MRQQWGVSPSQTTGTVHGLECMCCSASLGSPARGWAVPRPAALEKPSPNDSFCDPFPIPGDCAVDSACLPKHATYSCLIWTNLKCESSEWQQGLREHKWLHEVSALQITAVETADTAFPLVQYSKQGPLLALTSLPHYAQPSARAVLGQHTGHEVEDYCGSAIWPWIKSPNSSFPSWGPAL